jgi:hypothetical protein
MGMQTAEEVFDVIPVEEVKDERKNKEEERLKIMIEEATSKDSLQPLKQHITTQEQLDLFNDKMKTLS